MLFVYICYSMAVRGEIMKFINKVGSEIMFEKKVIVWIIRNF